VLGSLGGLLWWGAGSPVESVATLVRDRVAGFDDLLSSTAGALAWVCLCWFGVVVALHVVAAGSGALAVAAQRVARHAGPRCMLGAARWLVGATLLVGPLTSGVATAAQPSDAPPPASPAAVLSLDRPALPDLDRPLAPASTLEPSARSAPALPAPTISAPATPTPGASTPVASTSEAAAQPPTAAVLSNAAPLTPAIGRSAAPLLTGTPHRDTAAATSATGAGSTRDDYVVRRGDTLWDIAARHLGAHATNADIARAWPRWYAANRAAIGANPQLIHPGLVLRAPSD
jgi:hypothetical protein